MKKCIIFNLLLIFFVSMVSAQETNLRFGIVAEPVISWLKPDINSVTSKGNRLSFNVGLTMDWFFAKNYAFATGLTIQGGGGSLFYKDEKTFKIKNDPSITLAQNTKVTYKLQYLNIPFGIKLFTNPIGYNRYFGQLGFNTLYNIKATGVSSDDKLQNDNIGPDVNFMTLGYHIGGGMEYSLGNSTRIMAGLMYTNGFTDITSGGGDKVTLHNLNIKLGIIF